MNKLWVVARREYLSNLFRRSFLFAAFGIPLLTVVIMLIVFALAAGGEEDPERLGQIGYVDRADVLSDTVERPDYFIEYETEDAARAALDGGEIGGYFFVPRNYMNVGGVRFYSPESMPGALRGEFSDFLAASLAQQVEGFALPVERLEQPVDLQIVALDSGRELSTSAIIGLFLVPFIFVFVFVMASQITSGYVMGSVVEEKSNRIMEVLVTSVTPMQLLLGKVIGLGGLGLTQFAVWLIGGALLTALGNQANVEALRGISIPLDLAVVGLGYFLLTYFMMATLMAGIGAVMGSEQESRQFAGIFSFAFVVPFFFIVQFIEDANGTLPTILSYIPITAATSMLMRIGFAAVPSWQIALSLGILFLTGLFIAFASARVFRWSLLMYGKRPSLRELWRVIMSSTETGTSVAKSETVESGGVA